MVVDVIVDFVVGTVVDFVVGAVVDFVVDFVVGAVVDFVVDFVVGAVVDFVVDFVVGAVVDVVVDAVVGVVVDVIDDVVVGALVVVGGVVVDVIDGVVVGVLVKYIDNPMAIAQVITRTIPRITHFLLGSIFTISQFIISAILKLGIKLQSRYLILTTLYLIVNLNIIVNRITGCNFQPKISPDLGTVSLFRPFNLLNYSLKHFLSS